MNHPPQIWHYGLVAQHWAEFHLDGPEIAYYQKLIERYGQPALDVACGTGRLLKENRQQLDPDFWTEPERERASDGSEYRMRSRLADLNPLDQVLTLQMRAELWQDEQLVGAEERTLTSNIYFKNELLMMLKQAGFDEVTIQGDFTEVEATPEYGDLVFIARK